MLKAALKDGTIEFQSGHKQFRGCQPPESLIIIGWNQPQVVDHSVHVNSHIHFVKVPTLA